MAENKTPVDAQEEVNQIIKTAQALGVEVDETDVAQWLAAMAASDTMEWHIDEDAGIYGHEITLLDFDKATLDRYRQIADVVQLPEEVDQGRGVHQADCEVRDKVPVQRQCFRSSGQGRTRLDSGDAHEDAVSLICMLKPGIQDEVDRKAVEMGFTYLLGPIMIPLRPRLLTVDHIADLRQYARNLWQDAIKLEEFWRTGQLDDVAWVAEEEKELALGQPWQGSPALMVSDGLFSFGADLMDEEE